MPRKTVVKARCALCGAKDVSEPRGEEKYCRDCWDKKIAVEEIVAREFALKRYIRAHSAEKYLIYHSTLKRPCGQLIVVDDGYDLFLTLMLYPNFVWDDPAYHLEGDPEGRLFSELLVDVVAAEVEGNRRTITTATGIPMPEEITVCDPLQRRFQYRIDVPLVTYHRSTIDVIPLGDQECLVQYAVDAEPRTMALVIGGGARGALAELKTQMERQS